MKEDNFDEMLAEALKEYVKDTESKNVHIPKVKFSKRHEKNMEEIFKAVENATLGNFKTMEDDDVSKVNDSSQYRNKKYHFYKITKVAVWILLGLVALLAVAPSMTAWRSEDSEFYGDNQDEYAWLLRNDMSEVLESNVKDSGEYLEIFEYLPEGFELEKIYKSRLHLYIQFGNLEGEKIELKISENVNKAVDLNEMIYETISIKNIEVMYTETLSKKILLWNYNNDEYSLYSDINFESLYRFIENINFEKLKIFL